MVLVQHPPLAYRHGAHPPGVTSCLLGTIPQHGAEEPRPNSLAGFEQDCGRKRPGQGLSHDQCSPTATAQSPVVTVPSHVVTAPSHMVTARSHAVTAPSHVVTVPSEVVTAASHGVNAPSHVVTVPSHVVTAPSHVVTA